MLKKNESPLLMGILNVTPDSFSDGGKFTNTRNAVKHAEQMVKDGATIIDIGGESSRPGAKTISVVEELQRVVPVIKALVKRKNLVTRISIDTYKPEVAAIALGLGVDIVNDISGLRGPLMRKVVAQAECPVVLMHMPSYAKPPKASLAQGGATVGKLGAPHNVHTSIPHYKNVVNDIILYFRQQIRLATNDGIKTNNIILDPGIGFGKTIDHNLEILRNIKKIKQAFPKHQLLIGASRKSFIGKLTNTPKAADRLAGTLAVHLAAANDGADILRVHDVAEHIQALRIQQSLRPYVI
jgi:dihydropteroate synthase